MIDNNIKHNNYAPYINEDSAKIQNASCQWWETWGCTNELHVNRILPLIRLNPVGSSCIMCAWLFVWNANVCTVRFLAVLKLKGWVWLWPMAHSWDDFIFLLRGELEVNCRLINFEPDAFPSEKFSWRIDRIYPVLVNIYRDRLKWWYAVAWNFFLLSKICTLFSRSLLCTTLGWSSRPNPKLCQNPTQLC